MMIGHSDGHALRQMHHACSGLLIARVRWLDFFFVNSELTRAEQALEGARMGARKLLSHVGAPRVTAIASTETRLTRYWITVPDVARPVSNSARFIPELTELR